MGRGSPGARAEEMGDISINTSHLGTGVREETRGVGNGPAEILLSMFQAKEALRKHMGKDG